MDMSIRDLQGGPYIAFFGAWELTLAYLLFLAAAWLLYVIWVHREPGNFWGSITYTAGGRVIIGSVMVFGAESADHFIRFLRHSYILAVKSMQDEPMQELMIGYAVPFLRATQAWLVVADFVCWIGMVLWLSAPFNTLWRGNAVLLLVAIPISIFLLGSYSLPYLFSYWGSGG